MSEITEYLRICAKTATLAYFPDAITHPSACCKVQLSNSIKLMFGHGYFYD